MMANTEDVRECVIAALKDVLPPGDARPIDDDTDPIQGLGLDSHDGVAYACALSERLHHDIPVDMNPFVDDDKHRSRCVKEIIVLLCSLLDKKQEIKDE